MKTENGGKGRMRSWLETVLITLLGTGLGLMLSSADAWRSNCSIALLLLPPVLCGARYGLTHSVTSGALISALLFVVAKTAGHPFRSDLMNWGIACFGIGAVVGQYRDVAQRRLLEVMRSNAELLHRLERAKRGLQTLRLSHTQLEDRLAATRRSLASALETAARRIQTLTSPRELGEVMLELLSSHAMVQAASLYAVKAGDITPTPIASLGKGSSNAHCHALVERALRTRRLVAISDPVSPLRYDRSVLAAVPLLTSAGDLIGVVAIHQLPFVAFHADHLRKLLLIAAQLTDLMQDRLNALQEQSAPAPQALADRTVPPPAPRRPYVFDATPWYSVQGFPAPSSQGIERYQNAPANAAR